MDWTVETIDALMAQATDFKTKAILNGVKKYLEEQDKRLAAAQGQLDGEMWSPAQW